MNNFKLFIVAIVFTVTMAVHANPVVDDSREAYVTSSDEAGYADAKGPVSALILTNVSLHRSLIIRVDVTDTEGRQWSYPFPKLVVRSGEGFSFPLQTPVRIANVRVWTVLGLGQFSFLGINP